MCGGAEENWDQHQVNRCSGHFRTISPPLKVGHKRYFLRRFIPLSAFPPFVDRRCTVSSSQDPLDQILLTMTQLLTSFLQCPCIEESVCGQFLYKLLRI